MFDIKDGSEIVYGVLVVGAGLLTWLSDRVRKSAVERGQVTPTNADEEIDETERLLQERDAAIREREAAFRDRDIALMKSFEEIVTLSDLFKRAMWMLMQPNVSAHFAKREILRIIRQKHFGCKEELLLELEALLDESDIPGVPPPHIIALAERFHLEIEEEAERVQQKKGADE